MAIYDKLSSDLLTVEIADHIAIVRLNRPDKRNALDEHMVERLNQVFGGVPKSNACVVVLAAAGDHFSAGLDLVEHYQKDRDAAEFLRICLAWHEAFNKMEYAGMPIIAALNGAVVGGGLELEIRCAHSGGGSINIFCTARRPARRLHRWRRNNSRC